MKKIRIGLGVDLGNSATKVLTKTPVENGFEHKISIIDNRYGLLNDLSVLTDRDCGYVDGPTNKCFKIDEKHLCVGEIAINECRAKFHPTVNDKKFKTDLSKYAMILAFEKGYEDAAATLNVPMEELELEFDVVVLLPVFDIQYGESAMRELISTIDSIEFIKPALKKKITINSITVKAEGLSAFIGYTFDYETNSLIAKYKDLMKSSVLVIDIGAGTTDCILIKNANVVKSSQFSINMGVNVITSTLNRNIAINMSEGFLLSDESINEAVLTGTIKIGSARKDGSSLVDRITFNTATDIATNIKSSLDAANINLLNIDYVLLCGGGYYSSQSEKIKPLGKQLGEILKTVLPNAEMLNAEENVSRLLNVVGTSSILYQVRKQTKEG